MSKNKKNSILLPIIIGIIFIIIIGIVIWGIVTNWWTKTKTDEETSLSLTIATASSNDPKIKEILNDPEIKEVLNDIENNTVQIKDVLNDPKTKEKIEQLIVAGVLEINENLIFSGGNGSDNVKLEYINLSNIYHFFKQIREYNEGSDDNLKIFPSYRLMNVVFKSIKLNEIINKNDNDIITDYIDLIKHGKKNILSRDEARIEIEQVKKLYKNVNNYNNKLKNKRIVIGAIPVIVQYTLPNVGRRFARYPSVVSMMRAERNICIFKNDIIEDDKYNSLYFDIDIENAWPNILYNLCQKYNIKDCENLKEYVENRKSKIEEVRKYYDDIIQQKKDAKLGKINIYKEKVDDIETKHVKVLFLMILFGGGLRYWKKNIIMVKNSIKDNLFMKNFIKDIQRIRKIVVNKFRTFSEYKFIFDKVFELQDIDKVKEALSYSDGYQENMISPDYNSFGDFGSLSGLNESKQLISEDIKTDDYSAYVTCLYIIMSTIENYIINKVEVFLKEKHDRITDTLIYDGLHIRKKVDEIGKDKRFPTEILTELSTFLKEQHNLNLKFSEKIWEQDDKLSVFLKNPPIYLRKELKDKNNDWIPTYHKLLQENVETREEREETFKKCFQQLHAFYTKAVN